ncbi:MAG: Spy/CpxP family protein refolding chaperone [Thermoanaerobaculia bacterium]
MKKNRLLCLAAAACFIFAFSALGQDRGRANQTFTERYGAQLNLTDAQKKTIDELDAKFQKEHHEFLESYQKTMGEYRDARQANDTAKMDAIKPKFDTQRAEMMKIRTVHEEKIAATFNDAQKGEWKKIQEEREARMKQRQ